MHEESGNELGVQISNKYGSSIFIDPYDFMPVLYGVSDFNIN